MKRGDRILIISILIISILGVLFLKAINTDLEKKYVVIQVENKIVKKILINQRIEETYDFAFKENIGSIEVKNGAVRMKEMDRKICPRGICSDTGWIEKSHEMIVCLPNKIVVKFEKR